MEFKLKKLFTYSLLSCFLFFLLSPVCAKSKLTIKNTIGADFDELGDYDLFSNTKESDINDNVLSENIFSFGDQLQADFESSPLDARVRLDMLYTSASDADAAFILAPTGFIHYKPFPQLSIFAGNDFFKQFAIPSAYLAADDTTTKYGRLIAGSEGKDNYIPDGDFAVYTNGFSAGLLSEWNFNLAAYSGYFKALAGGTFVDSTGFIKVLDLGLNLGLNDLFDFGFTAHNLLSPDRKLGAFAGLTAIPNLTLNAGFYYNFTDSDYLPETRVERGGEDEFKKQKTKYALGITGGYDFAGIGLGIYADLITGLTNEYIGDIKYYDDEGNLIETVTTTIVRGETVVKYKDGEAKRSDEYPENAFPLYSQICLNYDANDSISCSLNVKLRTLVNASDDTWLSFCPRLTIKLPHKYGTLSTGLHLDMNLTRYSGVSDISLPFTYTYKFKKKF